MEFDKENSFPNTLFDGKNQLVKMFQDINIDLDVTNLDKNTLTAFEKILRQRDYYKKDFQKLTIESNTMNDAIQILKDEKDSTSDTIDTLKKENRFLNEKISAILAEHRDVKNHWLAEKSDYQSRLFQVQSLNTKHAAQVIKKDQEIKKLQDQLSKLIKDNLKSNKSVIMISKPIKAMTSQSTINPTLKDAELTAINNTMALIKKENLTLKSELQTIEEQFNSNIATIEAKYNIKYENLQLEKYETEQKLSKALGPKTPGSIAQKYLQATPGARPINWIIDNANTEMKKIRNHVDTYVTGSMGLEDDVESYQSKIQSLKSRLSEALAVIQEQDRLIHDALMNKLPNGSDDAIVFDIIDEEDEAIQEILQSTKSAEESLDFRFSDFLPPASPETIELLKAYGWSSLPRNINSVDRSLTSSPLPTLMKPQPEKLEF